MSSSAAASSYWRVAGMSYLKYSNLCADMVRASLKEPMKTKAKLREAVYYRAASWKDGKPKKQSAFPMPCMLACSCFLSCVWPVQVWPVHAAPYHQGWRWRQHVHGTACS